MSAPVKVLALVAVGLVLAAGLCLFDEGAGGDLCALHLAIIAAALSAVYLTTGGRMDAGLPAVYLALLPELLPPPPKG